MVVGSLILALASVLPAGSEAPRYDRQLADTLGERDATLRARARVEILFRAGDLPGALRETLGGLEAAPDDRELLRRALELETALGLPGRAGEHAARLEAAVREATLDEEARRWWERESAALAEGVRRMNSHEASLESATTRARWTSLLVLTALAAAGIAILCTRAAPRVSLDREPG